MKLAKLTLLAFFAISFSPVHGAEPTAEEVEFFEKKVRPALVEHCFRCHSGEPKKVKGKLWLDSRDAVLKGGESGKVLVPGQPEKSKLIAAIRYQNVDLQMPPRAKLPDNVIADLTKWVAMGAPWGKETKKSTDDDRYVFDLAKRKREHWAWKPITLTPPPQVKNADWPLSPIDRFLLAKLEEKALTPAAPADPRTLLRRLSFDLIGLPPSPEDVEAFAKENGATLNQEVVAKWVDKLLASPHFGERWGRHWLDLVRYAESRGHEFDYNVPGAYHYRDYVIRAFNQDLPYNQFLTEHLAGDLQPRPRLHGTEKFNESLLGTGFWFLGEQVHSPVDICQDKADRQDNMLDVMTKTFLGLTVSCARCHDHKFDAISTKDYYALAGFLESSGYRLACFDSLEHNRPVAKELWKFRADNLNKLQKAVGFSWQPRLAKSADYLSAAQQALSAKATVDELARSRKLEPAALSLWTKQLVLALKDVNDPLHTFARVVPGKNESLLPIREQFAKPSPLPKIEGSEIAFYYGEHDLGYFMQDGFAFGPAAVRPGDVQWGSDPANPIVKIYDRAAAESDPLWGKTKALSENEPGSLGKVVRAGRTLRTPKFKLTDGRVHYLVRGAALVYANVDGHVMIAGPLHGQLVNQFKTGPGFQWVTQDLTRYKGHRAHLEFTPIDGDCAVSMIVQGNPGPPITERPSDAIVRMVRGDVTADGLAAAYQKSFQETMENLAADRVTDIRLTNWILQHPGLFPAAVESTRQLVESTGPILAEQAKILAQVKADSRLAPAMLDGNGVDESVFIRGNHKTPGEIAPRRHLEALVGDARIKTAHGSGRLELAQQMTDPAVTPFVPRVMVNRLWHHLFGRGIVGSVDNFGVLGEAPTHPELLDFLADRFVKEGWSIKKAIRQLVLTRAYQMSSQPDERAAQVDPGNRLLQHRRVRRLEGEAIRDAILQVSGRLDRKMYGPSVPVALNAFQTGRGQPGSGPLDGAGRRSVYLSVRRNFLSAMMLAFDTPIPFSTVGRRTISNVPAQALILLNDPFVHQQAGLWAKQTLAQPAAPRDRIHTMYLAAFSRTPSDQELSACLDFLDRQARLTPNNEAAAWSDLAHALFNAKEFIFVQ